METENQSLPAAAVSQPPFNALESVDWSRFAELSDAWRDRRQTVDMELGQGAGPRAAAGKE